MIDIKVLDERIRDKLEKRVRDCIATKEDISLLDILNRELDEREIKIECPSCGEGKIICVSLLEKKCRDCGYIGATTQFWKEIE